MQKIVINSCFGGFSLSDEAVKKLRVHSPYANIKRDSKQLVNLMEAWGSKRVSGSHAELKIVVIPDGVEWTIEEYDGAEWVAEKHRIWR